MADKKEKRQKILIYVDGDRHLVDPYSITNIHKYEFVNSFDETRYCIHIKQMFFEELNLEFKNEEHRDKEMLNISSKLEELGVRIF